MLIDVEVAFGFDGEVEGAVAGNELEHVVEETDSRGDAGFSAAVQIQANADIGFVGVAMDCGCSGHGVQRRCLISLSRRCISFCVPMVMRTKPGPSSLVRSRRRMPRRSSF